MNDTNPSNMTPEQRRIQASVDAIIAQRNSALDQLAHAQGYIATLEDSYQTLKKLCEETKNVAEKAIELIKDNPEAEVLRKILGVKSATPEGNENGNA